MSLLSPSSSGRATISAGSAEGRDIVLEGVSTEDIGSAIKAQRQANKVTLSRLIEALGETPSSKSNNF